VDTNAVFGEMGSFILGVFEVGLSLSLVFHWQKFGSWTCLVDGVVDDVFLSFLGAGFFRLVEA
jgi:hypothetical protein